jgi:hypothetical protein
MRQVHVKKLLLMLVLVPCLVWGEEWLEAGNKDGGRIMLFTDKCSDKYPNLKSMMVSSGTGQTFRGCWAYFSGKVHVSYDDGTNYMYDPGIFEYRTDEKK